MRVSSGTCSSISVRSTTRLHPALMATCSKDGVPSPTSMHAPLSCNNRSNRGVLSWTALSNATCIRPGSSPGLASKSSNMFTASICPSAAAASSADRPVSLFDAGSA